MCPNCVYCDQPISGGFVMAFGEPMHKECEAGFVDQFYNEHGQNPDFAYDGHEPYFAEYEPAYV